MKHKFVTTYTWDDGTFRQLTNPDTTAQMLTGKICADINKTTDVTLTVSKSSAGFSQFEVFRGDTKLDPIGSLSPILMDYNEDGSPRYNHSARNADLLEKIESLKKRIGIL